MKPLRDIFAEYIESRAASDKRVIVIDCDTGKHSRFDKFAMKHPDQFIQAGICEQHALGLAAGYARGGFRPIVVSFAAFVGPRAFEQAKISIGMQNLPVIIFGTHAGFAGAEDGASHQAYDDIGLFSLIPNFRVITPADGFDLLSNLQDCMEERTPTYIRVGRNPVPALSADTIVTGDGFRMLQPDGIITVISCGEITHRVLQAVALLDAKHSVRLIHVSRVRPLPNVLAEVPDNNPAVILCIEDHYARGGLLAAVAELAARNKRLIHLQWLGVPDRFGESGNEDELANAMGLDATQIASKIRSTITVDKGYD